MELSGTSQKPTATRSFCITPALAMSAEQCFVCDAPAVAIFWCRLHCKHRGVVTRYYVCQACMLGRLCQFCHEPGIITDVSDASDETGDSDTDAADTAVRTMTGGSLLSQMMKHSGQAPVAPVTLSFRRMS